jgi:hypothetical protein
MTGITPETVPPVGEMIDVTGTTPLPVPLPGSTPQDSSNKVIPTTDVMASASIALEFDSFD